MEILMEFNWDLCKAILIIIGLDLILGGDNAIVIAMASRKLPKKSQNKAIFIGTFLAIFMRVILASFAIFLLTIPYLQLVGGIFLLYIAVKLLEDHDDDPEIQSSTTLIGAVKTIVIADVVMGFDNVLAIAAVSDKNIFLIIIGLAFSVPIIIFGSKIILTLMNKFPLIVYLGASLLAFTAADLILKEEKIKPFIHTGAIEWAFPLFLIILVCLSGGIMRKSAT
ncbi:hypothetical protein CEY16_00895 [Halalkalibacillus sediminis]|uniref:TerC family protein n=1 Tax=Halalkalibacillus sediminis TaxID=2018042 RepID=A0A2I0QVH4_9BACI|nr:TerC family protein [Halalkalibacillus sediminis]PKR78347.1 hypothetical protein CEY16_00895 [Halalkalibacillus sediminis]